ncbi:MAG: squalene--hopene cyclase [Gammaproteobacteria bacterium]|nr:squalene--hopene cyclase [Gammaproteobacteria bacterium]
MSSVIKEGMDTAFDGAAARVVAEELTVVDAAVQGAKQALLTYQDKKGFWCFELEADCTIPAEYILMMHFMDEIDVSLERKIAVYLRAHQMEDGAWPLYTGGAGDLSCTVKAYYALKMTGDDVEAPHMRKAREWILSQGGAARANVFTRITLAMFEQVPWRAVPMVPVEIILFPRFNWFPVHLGKVSYWTRTVVVPLAILCTRKVKARNPRGVSIRELFIVAPERERDYFPVRSKLNYAFNWLDKAGKILERFLPKFIRRFAERRAEAWFIERLNGEDGLGGIFPAMVNAYEAMDLLGYAKDHPHVVQARNALKKLLVVGEDIAYCQPCVSPIWDTGLSCLALQEADRGASSDEVISGLDWMLELQLLDEPGDWRDDRPHVEGGGWAFQFRNDYYPDLDDTAVVAWALHLAEQPEKYQTAITRAADWLIGMQSKNGGFAAFDVDNTHYYLNEIPFADHGALLDPPTSDVSARVLRFLTLINREEDRESTQRCIDYLTAEQEADGSWFGRWGSNYIYGTWCALVALENLGDGYSNLPDVNKAVAWLKSCQREDGGWGEHNDSYAEPQKHSGRFHASTPYHTAWALLALLAAGEVNSTAVQRGIRYLLNTQGEDNLWYDEWFNAPGFPRVFYLRYHGYMRFFPLWALARYRNLLEVHR